MRAAQTGAPVNELESREAEKYGRNSERINTQVARLEAAVKAQKTRPVNQPQHQVSAQLSPHELS